MSLRGTSRAPLLALTAACAFLIAAGAVLTVVLVGQWVSPYWSRFAIVLQGSALLLAGIGYRRRPAWRLLLYPFAIGGVLYLWDSTLPPPNLPDGPIRVALPLALLAGIAVDVGLHLWQATRPHRRFVHVYAGRVALVDAARIVGISPDAFRQQYRRIGRPIMLDHTGSEELLLADLLACLPRHRRATVFVQAHAHPRPAAARTQFEALQWPLGMIWWLAVGVTIVVQLALTTALPQIRASFTNLTTLILSVVIAALLWPLSILRVTLDSTTLRINLGPLGEQIAVERIVACQVTTYRWQAWGGFGHYRRKRERLYNVPGDAGVAVELQLNDGQRILFSARDPQSTCRIIRAAAARARQQPHIAG